MVLELLKEMMVLFTGVAKITTSLFQGNNYDAPSDISGNDLATLKAYLDFGEVIVYLKNFYSTHQLDGLNYFLNFQTSNHFHYQLLPFPPDNGTILCIGPVFHHLVSDQFVQKRIMRERMSINQRMDFYQQLDSTPYYNKEDFHAIGKLVYALLHPDIHDLNQIIMLHNTTENPAPVISPEHYVKADLSKNIFKFLSNLNQNLQNQPPESFPSTILDNLHLLTGIFSQKDNYKLLKYICIMSCTVTYCFSIKTEYSYETMFSRLWNGIMTIDQTNNISDILQQTIDTTLYIKNHGTINKDYHSLHVHRILQYLESHYAEKITLEDLSQYMHLNPVYISSLLKKETGITFLDHINRIRIKQSKIKLGYSNKSINDIAIEVGYNYQSHFNKLFKKYEGMTPSEYRLQFGTVTK